MAKITFKRENGETIEVEATTGVSLMQTALDNGIDEIIAECGGVCACATCHCYIDEAWLDKTGEIDSEEEMLLDLNDFREENSRLSCQIEVTDALDGLIVSVPESQF